MSEPDGMDRYVVVGANPDGTAAIPPAMREPVTEAGRRFVAWFGGGSWEFRIGALRDVLAIEQQARQAALDDVRRDVLESVTIFDLAEILAILDRLSDSEAVG